MFEQKATFKGQKWDSFLVCVFVGLGGTESGLNLPRLHLMTRMILSLIMQMNTKNRFSKPAHFIKPHQLIQK